MKIDLDKAIAVLLALMLILSCVLLAVMCRLGAEVNGIRETVEWYEKLDQMRYDSLEARIVAIEEGLK